MTVLIQITYISSENNILRRGSFPLRGRKPETVALEFWKAIKKEHPYDCEINKVTCDGEDLTQKVKELANIPI